MNQQFQHQRRSVRLAAHDYSSAGAYFATVCTEARGVNWIGTVSSDGVQLGAAGEMVTHELEGLPQRFTNLEIDEFIVMPDHDHVIFVLHDDADTATRRGELNVRPAPPAEYHIAPAAPHDDTDIPIRRGEPRVRPATCAARNPESNQLEASSRSLQSQGPLPANESVDSRVVLGDHVVHCTHGRDDRPYVHPSGTQFGSLGRIVQAFKSVTTVQYVRGVRESGWPPFKKRFWERNYWERVLRDNAELEVKRAYIALNPARHLEERGK